MARIKTKKTVITFPGTTQALLMEQKAREAKLPGRLIPVPREISAGCGMAFCAPVGERATIMEIILQNGIEWEGVYELLL